MDADAASGALDALKKNPGMLSGPVGAAGAPAGPPQGMAPAAVTQAAPSPMQAVGQAAAGAATGGGGGGGGGGGMLTGIAKEAVGAGLKALIGSDERVKKDVQGGGRPVQSFLDKLHAHEYAYKQPGAPGQAPGQHVSVMAQELEQAGPVGKSMVQDTPTGKMVDYPRGLAAMLAAQADLHHRVKALESGPGRKKPALAPKKQG